MGVARRTQRQFPMPPRALPPGRMGLLSPSGIGGVSPRHALTSPSLGGQGRQVSQLEAESLGLLGTGAVPEVYASMHLHLGLAEREGHSFANPPLLGPGLFSTHPSTSCCVLCRTCGLPIPAAATACPARVAALCNAPTHFRFTRHPRPFSCSLQVRYPALPNSSAGLPLFWVSWSLSPLKCKSNFPCTSHCSAFLCPYPGRGFFFPVSVLSQILLSLCTTFCHLLPLAHLHIFPSLCSDFRTLVTLCYSQTH